jgi:hypothetical protein
VPRSTPDEVLQSLWEKRDELLIALNVLEQAQGSEDAFELPDGPGAEIDDLRARLIAMEHAILEHKKSAAAA